MKGKIIRFYATINDLEPIVLFIENIFKLICFDTKRYLSDDSIFSNYDSILQIIDLGYTDIKDNLGINYLLMEKGSKLKIREIPQRNGSFKYSADPSTNQRSINFRFGGIYVKEPNFLIESSISYLSDEQFSKDLYDKFSKKIKKEFKFIDYAYVGKEAEEKLKQGWRLVQDVKRDVRYDLKIIT